MSLLTIIRRGAIVALFATVGIGAWKIQTAPKDPWNDAEDRLAERIDEYVALRTEDDWQNLYELVNPSHRGALDLGEYLRVYGHGVLKLHEIEARGFEIDDITRTAESVIFTKTELIPERLPAKFQRGYRAGPPETNFKESEFLLRWVWRDGEWYYLLETEVLTGRDGQGNKIDTELKDSLPLASPPLPEQQKLQDEARDRAQN